jgi:hypothetical protein
LSASNYVQLSFGDNFNGILVIFLGYTANGEDEVDLVRFNELLDIGAITEGEFNTKKKELLGI